MAHEITRLHARRSYIKGLLTKFKKHTEDCIAQNDLASLKVALDKIRGIWQTYEDIYIEHQVSEPEKTTDKDNADLDQFQTAYFKYISQAESAIEKGSTPLGRSLGAASAIPEVASTNVRLPEIQLKGFNGDHDHWLSFRDAFKSLIDSDERLNNMQKLHYLRSALTGEAANVIANLETTDANYSVAWAMLKDEYDNQKQIIRGHVQAILDLPTFGRDLGARRQWLNSLKMNLRSLALSNHQTWDTLLTCLIWSKLDRSSCQSWEGTLTTNNMPTWNEMLTFLERQKQLSDTVSPRSSVPQSKSFSSPTQGQKLNRGTTHQTRGHSTLTVTKIPKACVICEQAHSVFVCPEFLKNPINQRYAIVQSKHLCTNCLRSGHQVKDCTGSHCKLCNKKHNTLLHQDTTPQSATVQPKASSSLLTTLHTQTHTISLLSTAIVNIHTNDQPHTCRVVLDNGSQCNFITRSLANSLKLKKTAVKVPIHTINDNSDTVTESVTMTIGSRHSKFKTTATFFIVNTITRPLPEVSFDTQTLHIPDTIKLADPDFNKTASIDALFGVDLFYKVLYPRQLELKNTSYTLHASHLGWIVSGKCEVSVKTPIKCNLSLKGINEMLQKFWTVDDFPQSNTQSDEEILCEKHYADTIERLSCGRYQVKLPFTEKQNNLGQSYSRAIKRFYALEHKFKYNTDLKNKYSEFISEYEHLGHMSEVTLNDQQGYFLPHHAVIKEDSLTTKVRVVFDGSAKTSSGLSLNDVLMVGPTIQSDIVSMILRFRMHSYVLTADIEKMYRQVIVHPDDRIYQRILWRDDPSQRIKIYQLNTVTYGLASAPYLAIRTLHQLAADEEAKFTVGSQILKRDFYVDDLITGSDSIEHASRIRDELIALLERGGFRLRQWSSNEPALVNCLPTSIINEQSLFEDNLIKALGIKWQTKGDQILYTIKLDKPNIITKRTILSIVSRLFDPLGLIGPVIVEAKLIMRDLWLSNYHWDTPVSKPMEARWKRYINELEEVQSLRIPRLVSGNSKEWQLHGFCDASEQAYGACFYLHTHCSDGEDTINLLCAKSRVAPIKPLSIPRLELCAATLLTKLYQTIISALAIDIKTTFWSDSTIVLHWLTTEPRLLKTFVANRVAFIQNNTHISNWHHVPSADNPADFISRGQTPTELKDNVLWFNGPSWIRLPETQWPVLPILNGEVLEKRSVVSLITTTGEPKFDCIQNYSDLHKLKRVMAHCFRFLYNCKNKQRRTGKLMVAELDHAEQAIIKHIQRECFASELSELRTKNVITGSLKNLSPFIDDNGLLRVGGRLRHARISLNIKHPILLPYKHHFTDLVIRHHHVKSYHAGIQATLYAVRERYWLVRGRIATKRIVHKCITCFRHKPLLMSHEMGQLSKPRVNPCRPFSNTGIDYCGPFLIKDRKHRNRLTIKVYVAVFVCFTTKATHLEVVRDLTTEAFLAALRRFISRRGKCTAIYSDNASNFVGANNELKETLAVLRTDKFKEAIDHFTPNAGIEWHFIPPRAPHFGGLWEAAVKSFKGHFKRTIGNTLYTFEEFATFATEIEAVLNSRPLSPLSDDPSDLTALTPAHFLIGDSLTNLPEHDLTSTPTNRLSRWQQLQQAKQHLWKRWSKEYLNELQVKAKWHIPAPNINIGALVILHEENAPPLHWPLGRIIDVHPGPDGVIRVVSVKTSSGIYKRSVRKISLIPID